MVDPNSQEAVDNADSNITLGLGDGLKPDEAGRLLTASSQLSASPELLRGVPQVQVDDLLQRSARERIFRRNADIAQWYADHPYHAVAAWDDAAGLEAMYQAREGYQRAYESVPTLSQQIGATWLAPYKGVVGAVGAVEQSITGMMNLVTDVLLGPNNTGSQGLRRASRFWGELPERTLSGLAGIPLEEAQTSLQQISQWNMMQTTVMGQPFGTEQLAGAFTSFAPIVVAGILTGGSAWAVAAALALQGAGGQYAESREAGQGIGEAGAKSAIVGVLNLALGRYLGNTPLTTLSKMFASSEAPELLARQVFARALGEKFAGGFTLGGLTTFGQALVNGSSLYDAIGQAVNSGLITGVMGIGLGVAEARQLQQRAVMVHAHEHAETLGALEKVMADSKLAQRSPEAAVEFLQTGKPWMAKAVEFVDAEHLEPLLKNPKTADELAKVGITPESIARAKASGESVGIPLPKYLALPPEVRDSLRPFIRQTSSSPTQDEATKFDEQLKASAKPGQEAAPTTAQEAAVKMFQKEYRSQRERLVKEAATAQGADKGTARDQVELLDTYARTLVAMNQFSPEVALKMLKDVSVEKAVWTPPSAETTAAIDELFQPNPNLQRDYHFIGAMQGASHQKITANHARALAMLLEGAPKMRFWYEHGGKAIIDLSGGDMVLADKTAQMAAALSAHNRLESNGVMTIRALHQYLTGGKMESAAYEATNKILQRIADGEKVYVTQEEFVKLSPKEQKKVKTSNFYTNLIHVIDPSRQQGVTVDIWMMRAYGYDTDSPTLAQYRHIQEHVAKLAAEMNEDHPGENWKPHQVQASIWGSIKARWEIVYPEVMKKYKAAGLTSLDEQNGVVFTDKATELKFRNEVMREARKVINPEIDATGFADVFRKSGAIASVEFWPGENSGIFPEGTKSTLAERTQYAFDMAEAMLNPETGRDQVAELLHMGLFDTVTGAGAWKKDSNIVYHERIPVGTEMVHGKRDQLPQVNQASFKMMTLYSCIKGLLLHQDAMAWNRAYPLQGAVRVRDCNGILLDYGRPITADESIALQKVLPEHIVPITSDPRGVRLLDTRKPADGEAPINFSQFHKDAVDWATNAIHALFKTERYYNHGDYIPATTKGQPWGDNYRARIVELGGSDLLRAAESIIAPRLFAVRKAHAEANGWGTPGEEPTTRLNEREVKTLSGRHGFTKPPEVGRPGFFEIPQTEKDVKLSKELNQPGATDRQYAYGQPPVVLGAAELGAPDATGHYAALDTPRGGITMIDGRYVIRLYNGSDLSTLLHETAHLFLAEMQSIARSGMGSEEFMALHQKAMDFLGNKGEPITREQHEKWATHFEAYLQQGKAPTEKLNKPFASFRRWLTNIYEKLAGGNAVAGLSKTAGMEITLTPEVKEVFDRLLGQKVEAQAAEIDANMTPWAPPETKEEKDSPVAAARRVAFETLYKQAEESLADRLFAKRQGIIEAGRPLWREQSEKLVDASPVYRAIEALKTAPLDRNEVRGLLGDGAVHDLEQKHGTPLVTMDIMEQGRSPDAAAADFPAQDVPNIGRIGFENGADLINALRAAPTRETAVRRLVAARAEEAMRAYTAADAMAETPEYGEMLEKAGQYIAESLGRIPVDRAAIRAIAERELADMTVDEATKVDRFLGTMSKLQRETRAATLKGDLPLAFEKNRQSQIQLKMAREARKTKEQVTAIEDRTANLAGVPAGKVAYQYHINALALAARYELAAFESPADRVALRTLLQSTQDPELGLDMMSGFPDWVMDEKNSGSYRDMRLEDLATVDNLTRFLEARGRQIVENKILNDSINLDAAAKEVSDVMLPLPDKAVPEAGTVKASVVGWVDHFAATMRIWQFATKAMDGFTRGTQAAGPGERLMFDPLFKAQDRRDARWRAVNESLAGPLEQLRVSMRSRPKYIDNGLPVTPEMRALGRNGWTAENLYSAALNMGNTYNMEALAKSLGYVNADGSPDLVRVHQLVSPLTKADWLSIQKIWDTVNGLFPDMNKVFERTMGFPLEKVEAVPLTVHTADGEVVTLEGGYYPVKFDSSLSDLVAKRAEGEGVPSEFVYPIVGARKGMTISRTGTGGAPINLSLSTLMGHLKDTILYIETSEAVTDVYKLSQHPDFAATFKQKFGIPAYQEIRKMLADIGRPDQGVLDFWDKALNGLRGLAIPWVLGLNLHVGLMQPFSLLNFAKEEGWGAVASGLKTIVTRGLSAARAECETLSESMKSRSGTSDREISDGIRKVTWSSNPAWNALRNAVFFPITFFDRATAVASWWGAFNSRVASGMSPEEASLGASKAVTFTQPGAPNSLVLSSLMRDKKGWKRLLTSFATFTQFWGNRQRFYYSGLRAGQIGAGEYAYHVALEHILAPLGALAMADILWGNWPPRDDDQKDKMWKQYGLELGTYACSGIPGLREASYTWAGRMTGRSGEKKFGEMLPAFTGLDLAIKLPGTLYDFAADMSDEKKQEKALWALADAGSFGTGIPVSRMAERLREGWRQIDAFPNDESAGHYLNDLFTVLMPDPGKRGMK